MIKKHDYRIILNYWKDTIHRDANLWRPKIGRLSFFYSPRNFNDPPRKIDPAPNGDDLGYYMTSYMMYILSKFEC